MIDSGLVMIMQLFKVLDEIVDPLRVEKLRQLIKEAHL